MLTRIFAFLRSRDLRRWLRDPRIARLEAVLLAVLASVHSVVAPRLRPLTVRVSRWAAPATTVLRPHRRKLALGAVAITAGLLGVTAIPAMAAPSPAAVYQEESQSVSETVHVLPDFSRDEFTVTHFTPVSYPVPRGTQMASGWGARNAPCGGCSSFHQGLDWDPGAGFPIRAIASGVVTEAAMGGELGVHAFIKHDVDGEIVTSGYGHMQYGSMTLHVGQKVKRGQIIGRVGSTGMSTGPHLHFILEHGDDMFNPLPWLRKHVNS